MKTKRLQSVKVWGVVIMMVGVALALAACGEKTTPPTLSITSPANNATVGSQDVAVSVQVANIKLVEQQAKPKTGEGHLLYYLDMEAPTAAGKPAVPASGTWARSANTSYTFKNVAPGKHTIAVQVVKNDDTPFKPPVVAKVTVQVPAPKPTLTITAPTEGATLPAGKVTVSVRVTNFKAVDKEGQPSVLGEGHFHYFLDVAAPTTAGKPAVPESGTWGSTANTSYTFENVEAGTHTISVELVNNDHTPLAPPVVATVTVTVAAPEETGTPPATQPPSSGT